MWPSTVLYIAILPNLATSACVDSFVQVGRPVRGVESETPLDWVLIDELCARTHVGYKLIQAYEALSDQESAFCRGDLVPFGVYEFYDDIYWAQSYGISMKKLNESELAGLDRAFPTPMYGNGVLNLTSRRWHLAEENATYRCALCQAATSLNILRYPMYPMEQPLLAWHSRYDIKLVSTAPVEDVDLSEDRQREIGREIGKVLNVSDEVDFRRMQIDESKHLELHYHLDTSPLVESVVDEVRVVDRFTMTMEDISRCPEERVVGSDGVVEKLAPIVLGSVQATLNDTNDVCTRRECFWDGRPDVDRPTWSPATFWSIRWTPCTADQQYANENTYSRLLAPRLDAQYADRLKELAHDAVDEATLDEVVQITSREMMRRNKLSQDTAGEVAAILANAVLDPSDVSCMKERNRMHMIVVDLKGKTQSVVGFGLPSVEISTVGLKHNVQPGADVATPELMLEHDDAIYARAQFVAVVSEELVAKGTRLAFAVDLKEVSHDLASWTNGQRKVHDVEVTIVLKLRDPAGTPLQLDADEYYVDIAYHDDAVATGACAAWTRATNWTTRGCRRLPPVARRSGVASSCRCRAKYFAQSGDVLSGLYALKTDHVTGRRAGVVAYVAARPALAAAAASVGVAAVASLLAVVATAVGFNVWIVDVGNKAALQTSLALAANLALSATAGVVTFDTEGVGCLAFGVARHYTFLVMFLWMLVGAGVQVDQLMAVEDAEPSPRSNVLLKLMLFAWGIPWAPIVLLLISNPRLYRSDRFDRGYCYPEAVPFELNVLAPVGFVLLVTVGVFVVIAAHVFEVGTKAEGKAAKLSVMARREQVRCLRRSIVVYAMFVLIMGLHFLAEMREERDAFLFEFWFLAAEAAQVTVIAVLYVFLEEHVWAFWSDSFKKLRTQICCARS